MIKANELRIGNWVIAPNGDIIKVINIQGESINLIIDGDGVCGAYFLNTFNGVVLTPEILKKCGFRHEVHDDVSYYIQNNIWLCHIEDDWYLAERTENKPFQYLHQLQNLYFALTGEELKYNYENTGNLVSGNAVGV